MTYTKAIQKALTELGGRARLKDILPRAALYKEGTHRSQQVENTIRSEIYRHPQYFRRSPGKPNGWWELVSFQEEMSQLKEKNKDLENRVIELEKCEKVDAYLNRFMAQLLDGYKRKDDIVDAVRCVFSNTGKEREAKLLDEYLDSHQVPLILINQAGDVITNGGKKIVKNLKKVEEIIDD